MVNGRPLQSDNAEPDKEERARILARLEALAPHSSSDDTRHIGPLTDDQTCAYDGSLAHPIPPVPATLPDIEARAYLLTEEGGVLAELPCKQEYGPVTLGRGSAASIRVADPYVHRLQAEFLWDDAVGAHFISHGGGENGTYVNRHRVHKPLRLVGGEQLRVGKTNLTYRIRR